MVPRVRSGSDPSHSFMAMIQWCPQCQKGGRPRIPTAVHTMDVSPEGFYWHPAVPVRESVRSLHDPEGYETTIPGQRP